MKIISKVENNLKAYCKEKGFDFNRLMSMPRCGNDFMLFIQHYESKSCKGSLLNEQPAEVILSVKIENDGTVNIKSSENAIEYLKA